MKIAFIILLTFIVSRNSHASIFHTLSFPDDSVSEGKVYHVKAIVKKKLLEASRMIIKHERIRGLMPAMTMAFPVADTLIFDSCAVGSKGSFTLQIKKGFPIITEAHFTKPPNYVCPMHPHELSNTRGSCPLCGMPFEKRE